MRFLVADENNWEALLDELDVNDVIDRLSSNNQNLALLAAFLAAIVFDTLATAEIATSTTSGPTGWDVGFGLTAASDDPLIITANVFYISGGFALIGLLCVTLVCVIQDNTIKRITTAAALKVRPKPPWPLPLSAPPRSRASLPTSLPLLRCSSNRLAR